jgi:surface polysaccharide O-acyltransferase-like enzyme
MYYLFVLFFATTSAVAISSSETISIRLYVLSLATSLAIGFCGDYLLEILKNKSKEGQKTNE